MADPFTPMPAGTAQISATGTTASAALAAVSNIVEITNDGPDIAFVELGGSTVTAAAATGYPVAPGQSKIVSNRLAKATHVAAICASGKTATVYFTAGDGE